MIQITTDSIRAYGIDADIPDESIDQYITDAIDQAEAIAPGVTGLTGQPARGVAAVIRGAVARYAAQGEAGATSAMDVAGPFTQQSSFQARTTMFLPSEERKLAKAVETNQHRVMSISLTEPQPIKTLTDELNAAFTNDAAEVCAARAASFRRGGADH